MVPAGYGHYGDVDSIKCTVFPKKRCGTWVSPPPSVRSWHAGALRALIEGRASGMIPMTGIIEFADVNKRLHSLIQTASTPPSLAVDDIHFSFRVSSANNPGSFRIVTGGTGCDDYKTDLSGLFDVPATGGNNRYKTYAV